MDNYKYFRLSEFACKCGCGFASPFPRLLMMLDQLRELYGRPIRVVSGCRCDHHNEVIGGSPNSTHKRGMAADLEVRSWEELVKLAYFAGLVGFKRIGVGKEGVLKLHLDIDDGLPEGMRYYDR